MTFLYKPPKDVVERQIEETGVPPRDMVAPFNLPYKLRGNWLITPVQGNLWRCRLQEDQVMTGANVDTSIPEGTWNFGHVVRDFYFYQYVTATGVRDNTVITWEWARRIGGDFYQVRAGETQPVYTIAVEGIDYRTDEDEYRFRFNGAATNSVALELWVEVLRA